MTRFRANAWGLGLACGILLAAGCTPPPGVGDQTKAERYFETGQSRTQRQDYTGALAAFEQALLADPQMSRAHLEMATIFDQNLKVPVKALYHYVRALELNPNFPGADLVSNRLNDLKMTVAESALPHIGSPILEKQIDQLRTELEGLRQENERLRSANTNLAQQLAVAQRTPVTQTQQAPPPTPVQRRDNAPIVTGHQIQDSGTEGGNRKSPPSEPNGAPSKHTVAKGETFYRLAQQHQISVAALMAANPGVSAHNLQAGTIINIPAK